MATKKQKREAALAKRERFMAEVYRTGLEAQRKDRVARTQELLKAQEGPHEKHTKFEDWCLHCQVIKSALARGEDPRPKRSAKRMTRNKGGSSTKGRRTDEQKADAIADEILDGTSLEMERI